MIEGTYEKMLHFAHNVKSPITVLHMLGVILPILGLIIPGINQFPSIFTIIGGTIILSGIYMTSKIHVNEKKVE